MNFRPVFFLLVIFCFSYAANGQNPGIAKGLAAQQFGITDQLMIDQFMPVVPGVGTTALDILREQNIKSYLMPTRRSEQSNAEWSYALATCLEYYINLNKNYKLNLSPDYIQLNLATRQSAGTLEDAFRLLAEDGTVNAAILPYGASALTSAVYATPRYRIVNYLHVFRDVTKERQRVFELRKALMRGNPVLVEVQADASLREARGQSTWLPGGGPATLTAPLLVVGFDETREAFEVTSGSWGGDWGRGGYLWISYADLGKIAINGYVLIPDGYF